MKKVITMVGTSIFTNYFKENLNSNVQNYFNDLEDKRDNEYNNHNRKIDKLKEEIKEYLERQNINVSAEIKSLIKLKEELRDNFEIHLLYSDTIISHIAAELIERFIEANTNFSNDRISIERIDSLHVFDRKEFNKGMSNLISKTYRIADNNWNDIIINITGGYKATIPYLTILAQLNNCPIYYIFEDTDALIKIPNIPFSQEWFDWMKLSQFERELTILSRGITDRGECEKIRNSDFYKEYVFLIWELEDLMELNPIGEIIFNKYKEKIFVFFATDDVWKKIDGNNNLRRIFEEKFSNEQTRKNKTETKNNHLVYDDGDNQFRIFYRINENIYVYKVFDNHNEYDRYLKTSYSDNIINENLNEYKKRVIYKNR